MGENKHDIFISFSFKDQQVSEYVANRLLNEYKITYWMCTRDLVGGEHYKERIVNAIDGAGLVVMIQSENSLTSREVPKEVALALEKNKAVVPFVLDNAELQGDLEYDLIGIHRVDARRPTLDQRIEELAMQIYAMLAKKAEKNDAWAERLSHTRLLPTATIIPKKVFCGRSDVLCEINEHFTKGERVLFLYGIGGIGKTQIAKQYIKKYGDRYDTIVFATYNGSLQNLIIADAPFALEPEITRFTMADGNQESDADFFLRKLSKIQKITDERTLIVIDNFDVDNDEGLKALTDGKYHLLITTRVDYSRFYQTIKIDSIASMDSLKEIFMQNYGGYDVDEDDPKLSELIEFINRHTYTVELLAQHMENSGQTPEEMIEELKKRGIMSLTEEVRSEDTKKHTAYENLVKMFRLFSLTDEEKKILMYLSFMPIDGINVRSFRQWAHLDSTKLIRELENRSWIIKNTEGIALHPVIRDVIKCEILATEENCGAFLDAFTDAIEDKKMWCARQSEKNRYSQISKEIMARFPEINKKTEMFYYFVQCLTSFNAEREMAESLAGRLYEYNVLTYGENSFNTARAALRCAWHNTLNIYVVENAREAIRWLTKADAIFKNVQMNNTDEISRHTMTKTSLAKMYLALFMDDGKEEHYKLAKSYAEDSIEHAKENFAPGEFHYAKIGGGYMQLAEILILGKEYEEALEKTEKAGDILVQVFGTEDNSDMGLVYSIKAKCYRALGDTHKAIYFALKSAEKYEEYFGKAHINVCMSYLNAADCFNMLGEKTRARENYVKALESAELVFAPGSKQVTEIQEKIKALA